MALKKILVRLPKAEGFAFYRRAGLTFTRGADNVVEVTDEQMKALLADGTLAIGDAPAEKPAEPEKKAK